MHARQRFGTAGLGVMALAMLLAGGGQGRAGLIFTFAQDGPNVDATGVGSLNLAALTTFGPATGSPGVNPSAASLFLGAPAAYSLPEHGLIVGPTSFGTGGFTPETTGTGPIFGIDAGGTGIYVPPGYTSGGPLSSTADWANTTFSGLGLTPGTYTWTWGSGATADSLQVVIPSAPPPTVPEPSSLALLSLGGLALAGCRRWKRRPTA
jgi:PEP-CTERM motif